jgi:replicative DNA helicase
MFERHNNAEKCDIVWADNYIREKTNYNTLAIAEEVNNILSPKDEAMSAIEIIKRNDLKARFYSLLVDTTRRLHEEDPTLLRNEIVDKLTQMRDTTNENELAADIEEQIIAELNRGIEFPTGFGQLDYHVKGIEPGVLWVVGGGTSNGKTTFVLNLALKQIKRDHQVTVFSTEMIKKHLIRRFATMISGVNPSTSASLTTGEKAAFEYGVHMALDYPVELVSTISLPTIRMTVQKRKSLLYVVDYLQMIDPGKHIESEVTRLGFIVRELEKLTKQYDVCIVVTSQFSRNRDDVPRLSSYRGSGEIEENTDIGILMYYPYQQASFEEQQDIKDAGKDNIINLSVQKNRIHGLTGHIKFKFDRKTMRMEETEPNESDN